MKHVTLNRNLEIKITSDKGYFHLKFNEGAPIDVSRQFKKVAEYFRLANPKKTGLENLVINFEVGETNGEEGLPRLLQQ